MMFIIDYSTDYKGYSIKTVTIEEVGSVLSFVAGKSEDDYFKIHNLNKYENGQLKTYEIVVESGKIVLQEVR